MNIWQGLVRFGFRLLYHEMAFSYDWVSQFVSLGDWRLWQESALEFLPEADDGWILELAQGTGNLQIKLKQRGYRTIGYDYSAQMGRIAGKKLLRHNLDPLLVRGMGQALPFADGHFRAIVCTFPTDFIIAPTTLREIERVLCTEGVIAIVINGTLKHSGIITRFIEWLYRITGQRKSRLSDWVAHFAQFGLILQIKEVVLEKSISQVLVAQKRQKSD